MSDRIINFGRLGLRGESFADTARRTGAYGVLPTDTDDIALSKIYASNENEAPLGREAATFVKAYGVTNLLPLLETPGDIQDARKSFEYWTSVGTLVKGKLATSGTGIPYDNESFNYLEYTVQAGDLELRAASSLLNDTGNTARIIVLSSGGAFIRQQSPGNSGVNFRTGELISPLPAVGQKVRITGLAYNPLELRVKRTHAQQFIQFSSAMWGKTRQNYKARINAIYSAPILAESPNWSVFLSYGQSWEQLTHPLKASTYIAYPGDGRALTLRAGGNTLVLPPLGEEVYANQATDVMNLSTTPFVQDHAGYGGGNIGFAMAQSFVYYSEFYGRPVNNTLVTGAAFPGAEIPALLPAGSVTVGANTYHPYTALGIVAGKATSIATTIYNKTAKFEGISLCHGQYPDAHTDSSGDTYITAFEKLRVALNTSNFNADGVAIPKFVDQTPAPYNITKAYDNSIAMVDYAVARDGSNNLLRPDVIMCCPRWPYKLVDDLHHTGDGSFQIGWLKGYIAFRVLKLGEVFEPFRIKALTYTSGQIRVETTVPRGFGEIALGADDLVSLQLQNGFQLIRGGSQVALSNFRVEGKYIFMTPASAPVTGDEFSFAYRSGSAGLLGVAQWTGAVSGSDVLDYYIEGYSPVRGNVKRIGPPTPAYPGKTADLYLLAYKAAWA